MAASKAWRLGTHRLIPPEETVRRVRPLMARMGITRIANLTGLDCIGLPVVAVCRPNARSLSVSQGKGLDLSAAQASGLMEAVEAHHAEHIDLPLLRASYEEVRERRPVVDVALLPRLSVQAFHPARRMLWIEGRELRDGTPRWLPFESVHTDFTLPLPEGSGAFFMSSNGLASGNHPLEALSHALCEVVERDATCLWHLRGEEARRRTRLDSGTVDDPACVQVLERFERAGMEVAIWETTSDVGLASFYCVLAERAWEPLRPRAPVWGAGCHPAREVALLRALTEAAQVRLTFISGARDDLGLSRCYAAYKDSVVWRQEMERMRGPRVRRFQDVPTFTGQSFDEDVAWELARLEAAGLRQAVAVDLSRPGLGIFVSRVVVPGLEVPHDAPGYVPGRRAREVLGGPAA